ncbi:MAG TPA: peptidoglycan-binding domain-containing protein [Magnetospirillum sp.]|nr:peptidoglycan-binding domain-containing protein [Magnetospirillum sp.]
MKTALILGLMGALAVSPAMARDIGDQRSEAQQDQQFGRQSSQSGRMDQDTVRQVQQQLQNQGYDVGQVDGIWGAKSRQALMSFQRDQNIRASGRPDQQTLAALGVEPSATQQAQTPEGRRLQDQQRPEGGLMGR